MTVRRTLPHRDIRTIGAWCFIDDYGPSSSDDPPMNVPPHPHMGLQTVTWLLQVMPLFFYVGGHAHLLAWARADATTTGGPA